MVSDCEWCGKSLRHKRAGARFCTDLCRVRDWRDRRGRPQRARRPAQVATRRVSWKAIAEELREELRQAKARLAELGVE